MRKVKILHLSTPDVDNAAGIIPYEFHKKLSCDFESFLVVGKTKRQEKNLISYAHFDPFSFYYKKFFQKIKKIFNKHINTDPQYYFDYNFSESIINIDKLLDEVGNPDVILVYFMQGLFSIEALADLQEKCGAPILLFSMDMVYLTGGCHYAWECDGYTKSCDHCPAILEENKKSIASHRLKRHNELISKMNLIPLVGSYQFHQQTKSSLIFKDKQNVKFLLGIDQSIFYKKNKIELRKKYQINSEKFVILFGAVNPNEKRKGWKYLQEILNILSQSIELKNNILLISIGQNQVEGIPFDIMNLGYINSQESLSDIYNIADVFVVPSIQDSGPSMINQSIACGTPVVSFKIGVSKDLIIDDYSGYRVDLYDTASFADKIKKIYELEKETYEVLSCNCIEIANEKISLEKQVVKLSNLIHELVK